MILPSTARLDLQGQVFGRFTVVGRSTNKKYGKKSGASKGEGAQYLWLSQCSDCGTVLELTSVYLKKHAIKNKPCACHRHNLNKLPPDERAIKNIYFGMRSRCSYPTTNSYKNYGGRGITICDEWLDDPVSFYLWSIANGWREGLQIDRINNDGNYEPSNCRWITRKEQASNKRTTRWVEISGVKMLLAEAILKYSKVSKSTVISRIANKWSPVAAVLLPSIRGLALWRRKEITEEVSIDVNRCSDPECNKG